MKLFKTLVLLFATQVAFSQYLNEKAIWVKGEAVMAYAPNKATLIYKVEEDSKYPKTSKESFYSFLEELISKCNTKTLKNIKKGLTKGVVKVGKKRIYGSNKDKPIIYTITQNLIFNLNYNSVEEFTNLLQSTSNNYSFNVEQKSQDFWSTETKINQDKLIEKAIDHGKEKALRIAKHTKITLGSILFIREGYYNVKFQGFEKNYYESSKTILGYNNLNNPQNKLIHSYTVDIGFSIE